MEAQHYVELKRTLEDSLLELNKSRGLASRLMGEICYLKLNGDLGFYVVKTDILAEKGITKKGIFADIIEMYKRDLKDEEIIGLRCAFAKGDDRLTSKIDEDLSKFSDMLGITYESFFGCFGHGNSKPMIKYSVREFFVKTK